MKKYNLSFGQYPFLIELYDKGPSTQQNLAKIFQLNESTITRALNKLEEKGYIEREGSKKTGHWKILKND